MPKLTYCGHSCVLIESKDGNVIIDPFLTGNPLAARTVEDIPKLSAILLTHGHNDHVGDAVKLSVRDGAPVIATYELAIYCEREGAKIVDMNIGGRAVFDWGEVRLVPAWHSSSFMTESGPIYTGMPTGIITKIEGRTLYHLGDTCLFSDLKMIAERYGPIDVAMIPIGDHYTMGPEDAAEARRLIQPWMAIPIHYNTFPPIKQDPWDFVKLVTEQQGEAKALKPGEWMSY